MSLQPTAIVAAQAARPLRHWPDAALARARDAIERAWCDWCACWQVTAADVDARNACDDASSAARSWTPGRLSWLSTGADDAVDAMQALLFGREVQAVRTSAPIAHELAAEALSDLVRSLLALGSSIGVQRKPEHDLDMPPEADGRRWSGALRVRLEAVRDGRTTSWHLHCSEPLATVLCGDVQPGSAAGRPALQGVADAIATQSLRFQVHLDETTLTLGTLQSLHVGDVLPLSHRLDQPLHVVAPGATGDTPPFCAAFLGSRGPHRAVELVPAASALQSPKS